jgi:hypothetical protein
MKKNLFALKALLLGILIAQILSTCHVYLSNQRIYQAVDALHSAGYVTVPNPIVAPTLKSFAVAFKGGLFFTLSTGASLTLLSIVSAWMWVRLCRRRKVFLVPIGVIWAVCLAAANRHGFCPEATTQFLFIPPAVFLAGIRWMPETNGLRIGLKHAVALVPLGAIILSPFLFGDTGVFINIRDRLLLSNPLGEKINAFYYRYTMYPAELFKAPAQKLLKTCHIVLPQNPALARRIEGALARYDYLRVDQGIPVELTIESSGDQLALSNAGKVVVLSDSGKILRGTGRLLGEFSKKTDPYIFLRQFTLVSIFLVVPLVFFGILYAPVRFLTGLFLRPDMSTALSSILCTVFLVAVMFALMPDQPRFAGAAELSAALDADNLSRRISGLKHADEKQIDIANFPAYRKMSASPYTAERYWLARVLGMSRHPKTLNDLLLFLEDKHPNVVCMALFSIGLRKNRGSINNVMAKLQTSDHWYVQWYAYRALRELGWKQKIKLQ